MNEREYFIYILTNRWRTVLYTGITSHFEGRMWQHKTKALKGFTYKYNCDRLVYFEQYHEVTDAIAREKQIKAYRREKKIALIESMNPEWKDLAAEWFRELMEGIPRSARDDTRKDDRKTI